VAEWQLEGTNMDGIAVKSKRGTGRKGRLPTLDQGSNGFDGSTLEAQEGGGGCRSWNTLWRNLMITLIHTHPDPSPVVSTMEYPLETNMVNNIF
jgi:hypothetical protein